ncbi:hypothetical protein BDV33DRAFT_208262 [Aspergillus novoparasiticus]|uniref:MORN repeat protein n=1 Tax=Aspergillus novoparasiticus TaxID=986946 RepID=A0A5N6EET5_9EURO|nr:hypothetical protein BDV33DRAFT_208262 [Aspergillus novoparasiticus]
MQHGQEEIIYNNRTCYKDQFIHGQFKRGKYDSQGELVDVDGIYYKGQFKDDKPQPHGYTECTHSGFSGKEQFKNDGTHYKGQFKNGKYDGQGELIFTNGTHYKGQFKDGKFHGLGEATLSDGAQLKGQFKNHQYEDWLNQSSPGRPQQLVAVT